METTEEIRTESVGSPPVVSSPPAAAVVSEAPSSLRWGAIIGGTVAALGIGALLYSLGLALGLSAIDPQDPGSLRPSSIFTGVWALVVSLIALFVGGFVAARGASALTRMSGALHGLVMWGLTVVAGMWLLGNIASMLVSGAAAMGRTAVSVVGEAAPGAMPRMMRQFDLGAEETLAPINARLRAEGKPEVTPQQVRAATRDAMYEGMRQGRIDREALVTALTQNTSLERDDASQVAAQIQSRFQRAEGRMSQEMSEVRQDALQVAEDTGKAFWGVFGALLLGMVAAIGGALTGSSKTGGKRRQRTVVTTAERPEPRVTHREAYP